MPRIGKKVGLEKKRAEYKWKKAKYAKKMEIVKKYPELKELVLRYPAPELVLKAVKKLEEEGRAVNKATVAWEITSHLLKKL